MIATSKRIAAPFRNLLNTNVALLIYLNLDSDAFLKFFYVGYDDDMTTRLGGKSEEERGEILNIFNDIYRKGGRKLVDWK